ncbi:hypothetical protein LIER_21128 [Lithospermum erythrorhizon]|uniref:Uncharacterized protein n=1 Tax=Lithospermum erythrorhizon TaxID=34254 RepID=A0AAV3QSJ0_LITER
MEQLKERLPHWRGETPVVSPFVWKDREETYTHTPPVRTNNKPLTGQHSLHKAPVPDAPVPAQATDAVASFQNQIDALTKRVAGQMRRGINTKLIEEAEKRVGKGCGKRPMEDTRRRSALDRIRALDRGYSCADLPRGRFKEDRSKSPNGPPTITGRVNVISKAEVEEGSPGVPGGRMEKGTYMRWQQVRAQNSQTYLSP